jgi:hypothetical protein
VTGRTPNRDQELSEQTVSNVFAHLACPDGLTAEASTFTRPEVLVALGAGLAGAGRTELEALADRFLAERAVSVVADRTLEERRWSTPDLLAVEQQLVESATTRTGEQTAVASHEAVREALAPRSRGARCSWRGCRWWRPGACQACLASFRRCWEPSGSATWPIRPESASTLPPDPQRLRDPWRPHGCGGGRTDLGRTSLLAPGHRAFSQRPGQPSAARLASRQSRPRRWAIAAASTRV